MATVQPLFVEEIFGMLPLVLCTQALTNITEGHARDGANRSKEGMPVGKYPVVDIRDSHISHAAIW